MAELRHIIFFKIKKSTDELKIDHAIEILQDLGTNNESILEWKIEKSRDSRKGIIIVENSLFRSEEDLRSFKSSEKHLRAIEVMKEISDWTTGDYFEIDK